MRLLAYKICYLELTSWADIGSIGAEHTYAKLTNGEYGDKHKKVELLLTLSTKDAIKLNKKYGTGTYSRYKKGDKFRGFWTEADAIAQALKEWQTQFPGFDALVIDVGASIRPFRILAGLDEFQTKANKLCDKYEAFGWVDENMAMRKITDDWQKLFKNRLTL